MAHENTSPESNGTNETTSELIRLVGQRVRTARERKGIPRRVLSETSGVSPRYLAQLEAGEGNISIARLQQVAMALGHRIEWFVGEDDPWASDLVRLTELFRAADPSARERALELLSRGSAADLKEERICLIGLRGAGKSTLGAAAATALDVPFLELNQVIEELGGMPVPEIMALYGPEGYRHLEADALSRIVETHQRVIVAAAGGVVAEPTTYNQLLTNFHTIWLKAAPEEHMDRVREQGDTRPMTGNPEAMAQLRTILTSREALYARAEGAVDTTGSTVAQSLNQLLTLIEDRGYLSAE